MNETNNNTATTGEENANAVPNAANEAKAPEQVAVADDGAKQTEQKQADDGAKQTESSARNEEPDILDLAKNPEAQQQSAKEKDAADFAAYLKDAGLGETVTDIRIGQNSDGTPATTIPASEAGAILYAAQKAGIPADKAQGMLGVVAALDRVRREDREKEAAATLAEIRAETRKEFGDALPAAARDMVAGAVALFGNDLWNDICTAPALVNDVRFVRALANYGARLRSDSGGPAPASPGAASPSRLTFDLATFAEGTK